MLAVIPLSKATDLIRRFHMPRPRKPSDLDEPPGEPFLVRMVNAENYKLLAAKFMKSRAIRDAEGNELSRGFMIARKDCKVKGVDIPGNMLAWNAWVSYFRRKHIDQPYMAYMDHWMVPAEWPYMFDSDESDPSPGPRYSSLD